MSWELGKGLEGMRRVVAEHRIPGVLGPLIDLLSVMDQLHTAVEVCADSLCGPYTPLACARARMHACTHRVPGTSH